MNRKSLVMGIVTGLIIFFISGYAKLRSKTAPANILFDDLAIQMVSDNYMGNLVYIGKEDGYISCMSFDKGDFDNINFYLLPNSAKEELISIGNYQYQEEASSFYLYIDSFLYIDIDSNGTFDIKRVQHQDFIWMEEDWLQASRDDMSKKQFSVGQDVYDFNLRNGKWEIYNGN